VTKRQPQSTLSRALLDRLFLQLDWVHEVWMLRHTHFDGNRRKRTLDRGPQTDFLKTLRAKIRPKPGPECRHNSDNEGAP
jgi:hypothetical protein